MPPSPVAPAGRLAQLLGELEAHAQPLAAPGRRSRSPERTARLLCALGDPQAGIPMVHVAGTNAKTTTAWLASRLLAGAGMSVGTFTSPHLERPNERIALGGEPVGDDDLAALLARVLEAEAEAVGEGPEGRAGYFEILTAAAWCHFAQSGVEVAVVEAGIGGRHDATNAADATVAVVTNVGLDHMDVLGPTRRHIAWEKAGIVKPGSLLVLGEGDPALSDIFSATPARATWRLGADFGAAPPTPSQAGGRVVDLFTPGARYEGLRLGLVGGHQVPNAACALAAAEALVRSALPPGVVAEAMAGASSPGRLEVVEGGPARPTWVLDGAKNPSGAAACAEAVAESFPGVEVVLVVGLLGGPDPAQILGSLRAGEAKAVIVCAPESDRAMAPGALAAAGARSGVACQVAASVPEALARAARAAGPGGVAVVAGSFYLVGPARSWLARRAKTGGAST